MPARIKANGLPTDWLMRSLVVRRTMLLIRLAANNVSTVLKL